MLGSRRFAGQTGRVYSLCCAVLHGGWSQTVRMLGRAKTKINSDFSYVQRGVSWK